MKLKILKEPLILKQHRGIDLTIEYGHRKKVNIDEKAAATYFNKGLPTFALEIFLQ